MLILAVSMVARASVYRWTDESGGVHFGDRPPEAARAEALELQLDTYSRVSFASTRGTGVDGVEIFTTDWCPACRKAKAYFRANGIAYRELDIEKSRSRWCGAVKTPAAIRFRRLGATGVPVILVGERRMNGFSRRGFERLQAAAAKDARP